MIRELGKGAMGVVYLGRDPVIGRLVALKTIRAVSEDDVEQREFQERFLREAQAAGILSHPNIVTVHDVGEETSTFTSFIAMEYVEGKNLKQLVTEKTIFGFERIAEIIGQVAEALDYAHRRGIVHRDVKPANIIITPEGQVKITDFGIAKIEKSNLTTTGQFLGTPNYMSPEQVTGDAVDGRSDLFSLGVVLYELLTRKKPFTAENLTSISYKIVHERFVPPETYDAGIPTEFVGVLDKALAKDPAERFQRGNDFALALFEFKAREEERQMLRDLGQMVAEAEKLGPVATVTAPPSTLPAPAPAAPAPATPASPATPAPVRSPFEILASAPAAPGPRSPDDDLATREVHRQLPATTYVPVPAPVAADGVEGAGPGGSEDWQLDEPTRSKKSAPPPPPPAPVEVDVEASLPGAEVVEAALPPPVPPTPAAGGLAVSPFDEEPLERRPEGATEILRIDAIPGLPMQTASDRPTEILKAIVPPAPPALPAPLPPPVVPTPVSDRPTEILRVVPPPARSEAPAPPTDQRTEILKAIPPPPASTPSPAPSAPPAFPPPPAPVATAIPASTPAPGGLPAPTTSAAAGPDRPTEILRSPFPPPGSTPGARPAVPQSAGDATGEEGATERIVDAMKLARSGAPAAAAPARTPPPVAAGASARSKAVPAPPPVSVPPMELAPIPEPLPAPPAPPAGPLMKRSVNLKFVALVIVLVAVAGAVVTGVLWSQKKKVEAQAAVDEIREKEVRELKALMDEGNRLLEAGQPTAALEKFRELIRREPDSDAVRAAIARAEEQIRAQQTGDELTREAEAAMAAAREATELGEFDRALDKLAAVLLLQPENAEALSLRDSVNTAQAERAAAQKKAAAEAARRKRPTPVPTPVPVTRAAVPVEVPRAATPTPGVARLRIVFQSPAPEGYVMIRRNDKEVFRRNFDFGRKSAGGLVEGTIEVPSGNASYKAWAIPTNRSFNGYEAVELVVPGGESRTLLLELNAEKKLVVRLR
ncbi:MAG: protein kinase domain-containing protein [Thermoanaerobaculia bacterium]